MKTLLASFYKDLKLILSSAGVLAVLLPALLLPALLPGAGDTGMAGMVEAFPIAVRDEDGTIMSRSLIGQLRNVDLFSEVRVLDGGESDGDALNDGAVAVATIPKDLFYDVYKMADCPVKVTLNSETPLQSALFRSVFVSVMGIIRANHASALGSYTFAYGQLTPELTARMREETGNQLVLDALGRQAVFSAVFEPEAMASALTRRLAACVLGVLAIFFALCSAKTLPEELRLGVLPRLRAIGAPVWPFLLSKYVSALVLSLPAAILTAATAGTGTLFTLALYAGLLLASFLPLSALALMAGSPSAAQRWGNVLLLLTLALGGTLWPERLLPAFLRPLASLTITHAAHMALEARAAGLGGAVVMRYLALPALFALAGAALIRPALRFSHSKTRRWTPRVPAEEVAAPRLRGGAGRLVGLSVFTLRRLTGGYRAALAALAACLICGAAASSLYSSGAESLRLALVDEDGSTYSAGLAETLGRAEGVELSRLDPADVGTALLTGRAEGVVTIGRGYGQALLEGADTPLTYTPAPGAATAMGARELVAAAAVSQLRRAQAPKLAAGLVGHELSGEELSELDDAIGEAEAALPELYTVTWSEGAGSADPFAPSPMGFAALAALFTSLTAASALASRDSRAAARRFRSLPGGAGLEAASTILALTAAALASELAVLVPALASPNVPPPESLCAVMAAVMSSLAFASLSVLLSGLGREGQIDALAPMAALLICTLGGCFMDLTALGGMAELTLLSPAGLTASAFSGGRLALALLPAEAAALTALAALRSRGEGVV